MHVNSKHGPPKCPVAYYKIGRKVSVTRVIFYSLLNYAQSLYRFWNVVEYVTLVGHCTSIHVLTN